ncbi:uncharacterized protein LOC100679631 [Nasonia vitripennis]|uniref:Uncharacterized protein n=1 Tax=Nasonia vitripennis TaxID=7425 RepID=A0A7M7LKV6_NASVI|nr:uncharacterized protein LOC100679631 [Nasonia vitripennis]
MPDATCAMLTQMRTATPSQVSAFFVAIKRIGKGRGSQSQVLPTETADMKGKVLCILLTLVACTTAASIGGFADLGPFQAFANGGFNLKPPSLPKIPSIPGIPSVSSIPSIPEIPNISFLPSLNSNSSANSTSNSTGSLFGPFTPFLNAIPGLGSLISGGGLLSGMSPFPNIEDLVSRIPGIGNNRNGTNSGNATDNGNRTVEVPPFSPSIGYGQGPYIPGVSEALAEARKHIIAALNITSDFSTGMRDAVQLALDSDRPVESIGVIMNTIAKVYSTVAANCPLIFVGHRVFAEGVRLAFEVARSISNVVAGSDSNVVIG